MTKINLSLDFYNDKHEDRQKELVFCLNKNIENKLIDRVHVFVQPGCTEPEIEKNEKVNIIHPPRKITYSDFFEFTHQFPDDINILGNMDIFFDETISYAENLKEQECYALLRYNLDKDMNARLFEDGKIECAQDAWLFRGAVPPIPGSEFTLGIGGGDNRIAYLLDQCGYKVSNPCSKLKIYHYHLSNKRYWQQNFRFPPPYLFLKAE